MRVVLDTNVVVSRYWSPAGIAAKVLHRWQRKDFDPVVSPDLLREYDRVLRYPKIRALHRMDDEEIARVIKDFKELSITVVPTRRLVIIADDPTDNMVVECAVEANAHVIVSGDKHLLSLGSFHGIQILPPAAFLRLFDDREEFPNPLVPPPSGR